MLSEGRREECSENALPDNETLNRELVPHLHTKDWTVIEFFNQKADCVRFAEIERPELEPEDAGVVRRIAWRAELIKKRGLLKEERPNSEFEIKHDESTQNAALFEAVDGNTRRVMWDGDTISIDLDNPTETRDGLTYLRIFRQKYSEQVAARSDTYTQVFRNEGRNLPPVGLAMSVVAITTDGHIITTIRDPETPVYPGRQYMPGGGPKPNETPIETLVEELAEEVGLSDTEHFDKKNMTIVALANDNHFTGSEFSHPELIAFLPLKVTFDVVVQTHRRLERKQPDVWAINSVHAGNPDNLAKQIAFGGYVYCPPTEAALTLYLFSSLSEKHGYEDAKERIVQVVQNIDILRKHLANTMRK